MYQKKVQLYHDFHPCFQLILQLVAECCFNGILQLFVRLHIPGVFQPMFLETNCVPPYNYLAQFQQDLKDVTLLVPPSTKYCLGTIGCFRLVGEASRTIYFVQVDFFNGVYVAF